MLYISILLFYVTSITTSEYFINGIQQISLSEISTWKEANAFIGGCIFIISAFIVWLKPIAYIRKDFAHSKLYRRLMILLAVCSSVLFISPSITYAVYRQWRHSDWLNRWQKSILIAMTFLFFLSAVFLCRVGGFYIFTEQQLFTHIGRYEIAAIIYILSSFYIWLQMLVMHRSKWYLTVLNIIFGPWAFNLAPVCLLLMDHNGSGEDRDSKVSDNTPKPCAIADDGIYAVWPGVLCNE